MFLSLRTLTQFSKFHEKDICFRFKIVRLGNGFAFVVGPEREEVVQRRQRWSQRNSETGNHRRPDHSLKEKVIFRDKLKSHRKHHPQEVGFESKRTAK